MTNASGRIPPHSLEAEQYVLGCMLLDADTFEYVQKKINSSMFYSKQNQQIYDALQTLFAYGKPVDLVSVIEQLKTNGTLESAGGKEYLVTLTSQIVSASSAEYYADIIFDKYLLRSLISVSAEIFEEAYKDSKDAKDLLNLAQQNLFNLSESADIEGVRKISELIFERMQYFRELSKTKKMPDRIKTGFVDLDRLILGFQPGDFVLIAARPSVGKSALAMNIAQNMAIRDNKNVLFLSLEMSNEQLTDRLLSSEARVSATKLQTGDADQEDLLKLATTAGVVHESNMLFDDSSSVTVESIRSKCRRYKAAGKLDVVFVDYLQLLSNKDRKENRQQEITDISRQLKILAKDMKIPVIALSQLSRAVEQRKESAPMLSDLRESGAIEQDADMVMFLYRKEQHNPSDAVSIVNLRVSKNRNGQTGEIELVWQNSIIRFDSIARRNDTPAN